MGTHPIFESDFDCLTDGGKTMETLTFATRVQELNLDVHCRLLKMSRALYVWIGTDNTFGACSVGIPSRDGVTSLASVVVRDSAPATQLAARLSKVYKAQVFVGGNLGDECEQGWRIVEERLKEEAVVNPELFTFA